MQMTKLKVIPMPKEVAGADEDGNFGSIFVKAAIFTDNTDFTDGVNVFKEYILRLHNEVLENNKGGIVLYADATLEKEAYRIECKAAEIKVYASDKIGAGYALSTLLQLAELKDGMLIFPEVTVYDKPDCEYRSLMVDLARKWHEFDILLKYVDMCYFYKVKYLHLHFMDNESYTLPSAAFPKLPTDGRHYSAEQIKMLNEYAYLHGVEIIPEIEMPGHAAALVTAYSEIFMCSDPNGCNPENIWIKQIICAGSEAAMSSLKVLLNEVADMFPYSKYLHIGGDEAAIGVWAGCRHCLDYMKEHGIKDIHGLYSDFIKRATDTVIDIGKIPVVWEGFPKEEAEKISRKVLVVAWESMYHMSYDLVEEGFDIVNASWQPMYITPGRFWTPYDILAWNIYNWQNFYEKSEAHLNPIHLQPTDKVKGAMLCCWECTFEDEKKHIFGNLAAMSERTWNIRRYAEDEEFREKMDYAIPRIQKIIEK